jgi:acetoin utilization protein AcuB
MPRNYTVRDFMTTPAVSLPLDSRLLDAALTLRRTGFRHLPILEGESLVGIVTDRDVHRCAPSLLSRITPEEYNAIFEETKLERVMTRNPVTVAPDTPLIEAAQILHDRKLGCLPVVEGGKLTGIITVTDMLRVLHTVLSDGDTEPLNKKKR